MILKKLLEKVSLSNTGLKKKKKENSGKFFFFCFYNIELIYLHFVKQICAAVMCFVKGFLSPLPMNLVI